MDWNITKRGRVTYYRKPTNNVFSDLVVEELDNGDLKIHFVGMTGAHAATKELGLDDMAEMEPLREIDDGVEALCGGMCSCATCHVYIDPEWSGKLSTRGDDELELVEDTECFEGEASRLSCQITVTDELEGLRLIVAPEE